MKHSIIIIILCVLFSSVHALASDCQIDLQNIKLPPSPRVLSIIPVSATINETELSVYFETSVSIATITVYDELNQIMYQETVNSDSTPEVFIPVDSWLSGNYTLFITYGTTTLKGEFQIE